MNAPTGTEVIAAPKAALTVGARARGIVPTDIDQVWRLATLVVKSGLAPKQVDTVEKATVIMLHGLEIGLSPMMALQRIAVINGRPAVWGEGVPAVALGTNLVEDWFESVTGEGDNMVATCRVKRKGVKTAAERTFSVGDAKRAGLWDNRERVKRRKKDGTQYETRNDSPWYRFPKRMLAMRARVAFRDLFSDALGGLYIAEELDEETPRTMKDVTPPPTGGKSALPPTVPSQDTSQTIEASADDDIIEDDDETTTTDVTEDEATTATPATKMPLPPLAKGAATTSTWRNEAEGAIAGCEDAGSLYDAEQTVIKPEEGKASPEDWEAVQFALKQAKQRIALAT